MWISVLEVVQKAAVEMGLGKPAIAVSNAEPTTSQILGLVAALGEELAANYDWAALTKIHTFTTVIGQTTYDLPQDFLRFWAEAPDSSGVYSLFFYFVF